MDRLSNADQMRLAQALNEGWPVGGCGVGSYDPGPVDEVLALLETKFANPEPRYTTSLNSQQCESDRLAAGLPKTKDGVPVIPGMTLVTAHPETGETWCLEVVLMGKERFMYGWPRHTKSTRYDGCWSSVAAAKASKLR
jgi:hypothetical protein